MNRLPCALAIALCCGVAHADKSTEHAARTLYEQAAALYRDGNYADAAAKFAAVFELDPDPATQFDVGQAYRLAHECHEAAGAYRKYLAMADPRMRSKVEQYIADMEACAASQAPPAAEPDRALAEPQIITVTKIVRVEDRDQTRRTLGLALVATGAAVLVVGAYFTYDIHQVTNERATLCTNDCVWSDVASEASRLDQRGRRDEIVEGIAYGAGGAAVAAGAALYVLGLLHRGEHPIAAAPTAGGAQVIARWTF